MTEKEKIQKAVLQGFIRSLGGRFFTLEFFAKKHGHNVTRCAKGFSKAALQGGVDKLANAAAISYYDVNKKGYRAFNIHNLAVIRCGEKVRFGPIMSE